MGESQWTYCCCDRLLQDSRVNPSANDNEAIKYASINGHHLVVDRLLQDRRADPTDNNNIAIRNASRNGHHLVVNRLLQEIQKRHGYVYMKWIKLLYAII